MNILGFSTTHDSGATLLKDGRIVAAVNEERFNRTKHYGYLPFESIQYCLDAGGISPKDLDAVAVPSDTLRTDAKLLLNCEYTTKNISREGSSLKRKVVRNAAEAVRGISERNTEIPDYARTVAFPDGLDVHLVNHHESHAASAYYALRHDDDTLVVTLDGLGDRLSGTVWYGDGGKMKPLQQWGREGSLGWFYGIVTQALGWWIGNGEGKTMGLGSYVETDQETVEALCPYVPKYRDGELVDDYSFSRPSRWEVKDTLHWWFEEANEIERIIESQGRKQVAAAAQHLLEEQVLEIIRPWLAETGASNLAAAGGVFLNVQVNSRVLDETSVDDYFVFPNAGDGGLPTGAAFTSCRSLKGEMPPLGLENVYFGPDITDGVREQLDARQLDYSVPDDVVEEAADMLADGKILAWCQGRMEYGPRALGNRSILIDPTRPDSMDRVNARVKFRDSWRPFAPSMLANAADQYLVNPVYDPFMLTAFEVKEEKQTEIPAVTHVDGTTRPQMVRKEVNEPYWRLIKEFERRTGTPVLLNTSFNLSGDPIVCDAVDAIETFYASGLDGLVIGDTLIRK